MRKMTKMISFALIALLMAVQISSIVLADTEPNDTFESAEYMGEGTYTGQVSLNDSYDYYRIEIPAHMMVNIVITADYDSDLDVSLYDQNRTEVDYGYPSDGASSNLSYDPAGPSETVYLKIELGSIQSYGNYTIEVSFSDSFLEGLTEDLVGAVSTLMWTCIAGVIIVVILIIVIIVFILKKKKSKPPQQYPPQAQYPEQQQAYQNTGQYPSQQPGDQQPPQNP